MNILLIPSAKKIANELRVDFGEILPASLPLGYKTALEHIYEVFNDKVQHMVIGVDENSEDINELINRKNLKIDICKLNPSEDLGSTIAQMMDYAIDKYNEIKSIYINFADTILPKLQKDEVDVNRIYYEITDNIYRWTSFNIVNGKIEIRDKFTNPESSDNKVFVGCFYITNILKFKNILDASAEDSSIETDSFYMALQSHLNSEKDWEIKCLNEWVDLGHIDTYYQSKVNYINTRYFNTIEIKKNEGILHKRSDNEGKLINEINWYHSLPENMKIYVPRIINSSTSKSNVFIDLEFYGYPTLAEIYLFSNYHESNWYSILLAIQSLFDKFLSAEKFYTRAEIEKYLYSMYVDKTIARIKKLLETKPIYDKYLHDQFSINGRPIYCLDKIISLIPDLLKIYDVYSITKFHIIHGDFCLSNILYDVRSNTIKLVDPRGSFGKAGIWGDYRYDLAKLSHSFNGGYELILYGYYTLEIEADNINYEVIFNQKQKYISKLYMNMINRYASNEQISLIEGLLFLSMLPLHSDDEARQMALFCRGVELLMKLIEGLGI